MAGKFVVRYFPKNVEFSTVWMIHLLYSMLLRIRKYERLVCDSFQSHRVFESVKFRLETYCQVANRSAEFFLLLTFSGSSCKKANDAEIFSSQNRRFGTWYIKLASCQVSILRCFRFVISIPLKSMKLHVEKPDTVQACLILPLQVGTRGNWR